MCVCVCVCMYVWLYVCMHVCMIVYVHIHTYVYTHETNVTHADIHTSEPVRLPRPWFCRSPRRVLFNTGNLSHTHTNTHRAMAMEFLTNSLSL
jgi:hypothetical protein